MTAPSATLQTPPAPDAHVPALDGLRGVAILMVVAYHFYGGSALVVDDSKLWIDRAVSRLVETGWSGVDLFFVLSGFLITGILLDAKSGMGFFRNFYARRVLRIFPVYYGFLFLLIVLLPEVPGLRGDRDLDTLRDHQFWYWSYLFNIWVAFEPATDLGFYGNGHLWSLAIEEQFYLVWPLVVFALGRRTLMGVCTMMVVAALLVRVAITQGAVPALDNIFAPVMLMPARMDTLALGALLATLAREPQGLTRARAWAPAAALAAVGTVAVIFAWKREFSLFDEVVVTVGLSALAVLFAAGLTTAVTAASGDSAHRFLTLAPLRALGKYSYAMYLFHLQLMFLAVRWMGDADASLPVVFGSALPMRMACALSGVLASLALAWLSWHLYEKHFLTLKRHFASRRVATAAGLTAGRPHGDERAIVPAP